MSACACGHALASGLNRCSGACSEACGGPPYYAPESDLWTVEERQYVRDNGYLGEAIGSEDEGARAERTVAALVKALDDAVNLIPDENRIRHARALLAAVKGE